MFFSLSSLFFYTLFFPHFYASYINIHRLFIVPQMVYFYSNYPPIFYFFFIFLFFVFLFLFFLCDRTNQQSAMAKRTSIRTWRPSWCATSARSTSASCSRRCASRCCKPKSARAPWWRTSSWRICRRIKAVRVNYAPITHRTRIFYYHRQLLKAV